VVALAEIGDKTQLLALVLAARYGRPLPIIVGILIATVANHALAAWLGVLAAGWLGAETLRWLLGLSFLAMAGWMLVPDKMADGDAPGKSRLGPFLATLIAFFLVEIGDKTQVATVALSARFNSVLLVTAGTSLGMMIANVPVVLLGGAAAAKIPLRPVRAAAALTFAALGLLALLNLGEVFGGG